MTVTYKIHLSIFFMLLVFLSTAVEAKKRCKPYLEKLQNIQKKQRQGASLTRSNSLRVKEDKARKLWWQCEHTSMGSKKKIKASKKKSEKNKKTLQKINRTKAKDSTLLAGTPFKTEHAIVFKSKYSGNKQEVWRAYYQQPKKCQQPSSMAVFTFCSENKRQQRESFELQYKLKFKPKLKAR